ncbi:MAG: biotin transporter BioY [Geodermatophilaceae bacterium]|nr:biotin transporter BioY [Geodermatophilaceae bacterium]
MRPSRSLPARALPARDLARVAVFAALIAVLGLPGQLPLFGNAVPVTLQTLGVMLAGSLLGARLGALSVAAFLILVAAGLPLLAGGRGGLGVFVGPSAGYLLGFVLGAFVIGWILERGGARYRPGLGFAANFLGGIVVVYAIGIPLQALITDTSLLVTAGLAAAFLIGDLIKAVIATLVAAGVHRAYPQLSGRRRTALR